MNVLVIGSGGREHAIAWKVSQSPRLSRLFTLPGNPGTAELGENVGHISLDNHPAVVQFCQENRIDLVIVGPEAPLAAGLADALIMAGIRCFGPRKAAAQIEASKAFAKQFMTRHNIPTARYGVFKKHDEALDHLQSLEYPVALKASGLAGGKGVVLPENKDEARSILGAMLVRKEFGAAGREVVIEERLSGPEVSLMAFSDGQVVRPMLPAQDHKRLLDGDRGPNTGGMGACAPVPVCPPEMVDEIVRAVLQPAISGLYREETPFVGVLFAGLMLTADGPRVLEFNCRFGDPESQAVLPLLEGDLLEIAEACVEKRLEQVKFGWKDESTACVVLASEGYPGKLMYGRLVKGSRDPFEKGMCFHAGTRLEGNKIVTSGGRVVGVTAWDATLEQAVQRAYAAIEHISFHGMQYRRDIARHTLKRSAYAEAGVSIDAGNKAVQLMKESARSTYGPEVLAGIGAFGGLFDASALKKMSDPVLVASTDGVGTKVKLAAQAGRYRLIGHDIVNHCINDILVQGARPLFFLDYFASSVLKPELAAEVVHGISEACRDAGMALLGGETAEMPGIYAPGEFDLAGSILGVVERSRILPRTSDLKPGDALIGLASSGPHTNGYSLIRKVFADVALETVFPELGIPLADALLVPHRSYFPVVHPLLTRFLVKALAHLTGGGFVENLPRVLPGNLNAVIRRGSWPTPPLWGLIQKRGEIAEDEMYRIFNLGIGMVMAVESAAAQQVQQALAEPSWLIGELAAGEGKVVLA